MYQRFTQDAQLKLARGEFLQSFDALGASDVHLAIADGAGGCADVYALTTQHLDVVKRKIADLRKLERILSQTAARCARDASPECPIIEALSTPHRPRPRQA